jgi:hypothetical protein
VASVSCRFARRGDRVRLVRALDTLPAGAQGRIFGYLRRPEGDGFAVAFDTGPSRILEAADLKLVSTGAAPEGPSAVPLD